MSELKNVLRVENATMQFGGVVGPEWGPGCGW